MFETFSIWWIDAAPCRDRYRHPYHLMIDGLVMDVITPRRGRSPKVVIDIDRYRHPYHHMIDGY